MRYKTEIFNPWGIEIINFSISKYTQPLVVSGRKTAIIAGCTMALKMLKLKSFRLNHC